MAASCWPPLAVPVHYDPSFKVTVQLHEPLLLRTEPPAEVEAQMTALCNQLDVLCKREKMKQPGHRRDRRTSGAFVDNANAIYDQMKQLLTTFKCQIDVQTYIQSKQLDRQYPQAAAYIAQPGHVSLPLKETRHDNYSTHKVSLHRLKTLAEQIHNDVSTQPKPKYIPHQLTSLYQAITDVKGGATYFAIHKKNIEDNFKIVKAAFAANSDATYVAPEIREWMMTLTNSLVSAIMSLPGELIQE